jgi:AAA domain
MHWTDTLIIDAMSRARSDGWEICASETTNTAAEAILDDLALRSGAKRAAETEQDRAKDERRFARAEKCYALDDAAYAKWFAAGEPDGRALKFDRWKKRRLHERRRAALDEMYAMDRKLHRIHVAADSTDAECEAAEAEHEKLSAAWHQYYDHLWPELLDAAPSIAPGTPMPPIAPKLTVVPVAPLPRLIKTSKEFIAGYKPPDYLIDGVLQRRYIYSMTGGTGVGKTSIALRWTGHVITGRPIGEREVERGKVLYFAGENPDDVMARWFVLCREMGIDPETDMVQWVDGAMNLMAVTNGWTKRSTKTK